ncbi:MAG: NAD(P)H-hydrate dehydratase [Deltaproteobacteria bacterium]|jgi:NAD(P)H-hydrate epimerase|nr:NAD(P)H-hydrate dehydratase [Deltaproteobacteria bacterium]
MNLSALYHDLGLPLPTPGEMASWDAASIGEFALPEILLMENAGREAFHVLTPMLEARRRILVIMGAGNNGGDGAALARHLLDAGHQVLVCHVKPLDTLSETSRAHAAMAAKAGVPFINLDLADNRLITPPEYRAIAHTPHCLVDALLGTGFHGALRDKELAIIRYINRMRAVATVFSLDIPSGLDGLTGLPRPEAVRADHTVTFEAAKTGLAFPHAAACTGTLHVRRIGIPAAVQTLHPPSFRLLAPQACVWPALAPDMHKGDAGRVLIFGGSQGLTGAPALSALGALRAGAGLVTVACPGALEGQIRPAFPEIMTLPLGAGTAWSNALAPACAQSVRELPQGAAIVLGPGMGRFPEARDIVETIIREKKRPPLVLDADGLSALAPAHDPNRAASLLASLREDDCITPHPGEAARILKSTTEDVQAARVESLRILTAVTRAVVVLKGAGTLIARDKSPIFVAPFAAPSLAVGGSGDILAGIIAAHLAQLRSKHPATAADAFRAVCLGVFLHGRAGKLLDEKYPHRGALAREIADAVPRVER